LIYPNPLNPAKYAVLNTGLTIDDRGYNGDYGRPLWGDYAIVKVKLGAAVPICSPPTCSTRIGICRNTRSARTSGRIHVPMIPSLHENFWFRRGRSPRWKQSLFQLLLS
jgi:hypothetical protein